MSTLMRRKLSLRERGSLQFKVPRDYMRAVLEEYETVRRSVRRALPFSNFRQIIFEAGMRYASPELSLASYKKYLDRKKMKTISVRIPKGEQLPSFISFLDKNNIKIYDEAAAVAVAFDVGFERLAAIFYPDAPELTIGVSALAVRSKNFAPLQKHGDSVMVSGKEEPEDSKGAVLIKTKYMPPLEARQYVSESDRRDSPEQIIAKSEFISELREIRDEARKALASFKTDRFPTLKF